MRVWYIEARAGETIEDLFIQSPTVLTALSEARQLTTLQGATFTVH